MLGFHLWTYTKWHLTRSTCHCWVPNKVVLMRGGAQQRTTSWQKFYLTASLFVYVKGISPTKHVTDVMPRSMLCITFWRNNWQGRIGVVSAWRWFLTSAQKHSPKLKMAAMHMSKVMRAACCRHENHLPCRPESWAYPVTQQQWVPTKAPPANHRWCDFISFPCCPLTIMWHPHWFNAIASLKKQRINHIDVWHCSIMPT